MLPRDRFLNELAYYPSGSWLKAMSFGESVFLADLTWLRAVQYYGEHRQLDNKFDLLHMAFDVVTNFDPRHQNAYVFGGTSLAQEGRQFAKGEELLLKGRAADPEAWIYPFELGFIHYVERRDHISGSRRRRGSRPAPGTSSALRPSPPSGAATGSAPSNSGRWWPKKPITRCCGRRRWRRL